MEEQPGGAVSGCVIGARHHPCFVNIVGVIVVDILFPYGLESKIEDSLYCTRYVGLGRKERTYLLRGGGSGPLEVKSVVVEYSRGIRRRRDSSPYFAIELRSLIYLLNSKV